MAGQKILGDMIVRVIGQNAEFDQAIDKSEAKLKKFSESASKIGRNLTKFITLPIVGIGTAAIKTAADMEQSQLAFETLLGSGQKAKVLLGQLQKFASTTPFEFEDLAQGAKTLLSFGVEAEKILPITKQLGDIALGDSEKFKSLSLVFGQISSTGRLMGQDLLQLINVGFNPLQEISRRTGESMAELKKRMEDGKISAEEVSAAFQSATSEGGRFFEGTQKLGNSFTGLVSTLKDDAVTLARSFGELVLPTLKDIVKSVSGIIQELNKLDPGVKQTIINFALVAAAAGPLIGTIGKIGQAVTGFIDILGKAKLAVQALATINPAFLWIAGISAAIGLVGVLVEAIRNTNKETEAAIAAQFKVSQFDASKTFRENSAAYQDAAKKLLGYNQTIRTLEQRQANGLALTVQQTNALNEAKSAYDALKQIVDRLAEGTREQAKAQQESAAVTKQTTADIFTVTAAQKALNEATLVANQGFANASANMHAFYLQQQADIVETQRINDETRLAANAGFADQSAQIAAGFAERAIAGKIASDQQIAAANATTEAQKKNLEELKTFSSLTYSAIETIITSVFDAQMNMYDKDSAEYKKATHDKAVANKVFALAQIAISTAQGIAEALKLAWPLNLIAGIAIGAAGAAQAIAVASTPIPELAEGGIVPATPGGQMVRVAEAGQSEAVIPLDRLPSIISSLPTSSAGGNADTPIQLTIKLDRDTLYSGIFNASKNKTVLISAEAIV